MPSDEEASPSSSGYGSCIGSAAAYHPAEPGLTGLRPGPESDADLGAQGPASALEAFPTLASPAQQGEEKGAVGTDAAQEKRKSKAKSKSELASAYKTLHDVHQQNLETLALILGLVRDDLKDHLPSFHFTQQDTFVASALQADGSHFLQRKGDIKTRLKQKRIKLLPHDFLKKLYKTVTLHYDYTRFLQQDCHENNLLEFFIIQMMFFNICYIDDLLSLDRDQFNRCQAQAKIEAYARRMEQLVRFFQRNQASLANISRFCCQQWGQEGKLPFTQFIYALVKDLLIIPEATEALWYRELVRERNEVTIGRNTKELIHWLFDNQAFFSDFFENFDAQEDHKSCIRSIIQLSKEIEALDRLINESQNTVAEEKITAARESLNLCIGDVGLIALDRKLFAPFFSIYYPKDVVRNGSVAYSAIFSTYYLHLQSQQDPKVIKENELVAHLLHPFAQEACDIPALENRWFSIYI